MLNHLDLILKSTPSIKFYGKFEAERKRRLCSRGKESENDEWQGNRKRLSSNQHVFSLMLTPTLFISRSSSNNCSFRAGAFSYLLPHWLLCAGEKSCHLNKLICCHCYVGFKYLLYLVSTLTLTVSTHNSGMFLGFFSCKILKQTKIIINNNKNLLSFYCI